MQNKQEDDIDALTSAIVEQVKKDLKARSQRIIVGWVLGIIVASGGIVNMGFLESAARPDPARGNDLRRLDTIHTDDRRKIKNDLAEFKIWVKGEIQTCKNALLESNRDKPPGPTRLRIEACEQSLRRIDPQYKQPTYRWYD